MVEGKEEKIGQFRVGDLVRMKCKIISTPTTPSQLLNLDAKFVPPLMVVSEVFKDEKAAKNKKMKDIGTCIRVKCQWFYQGKCEEQIFWEHVLQLE